MSKFKYQEDKYLEEARAFIETTYAGHYVGQDGIQSLDLILGIGHGDGFTIGSALKYLARYGKKRGHNRDDLLKALHYIVLTLYNHDKTREKTDNTIIEFKGTDNTIIQNEFKGKIIPRF